MAFDYNEMRDKNMILAVDIGNTNIVVGCIHGEEICFVAVSYTHLDVYKRQASAFPTGSAVIVSAGCVICSVSDSCRTPSHTAASAARRIPTAIILFFSIYNYAPPVPPIVSDLRNKSN